MSSVLGYSFVSKKDPVEKLELLESTQKGEEGSSSDNAPADVTFKVLRGSVTANNKFYWSFGEKPPFKFNKCYPVNSNGTSKLVDDAESNKDCNLTDEYMHPPVWGIAEVTSSNIDKVEVGTQYMALLPMGESVSFAKAKLNPEDDTVLIVDRPEAFVAYNTLSKIDTDSPMRYGSEYSDYALACSPGIVTGHGLYFRMVTTNCYGADTVVVTSASSKVALAMALYMKNDPDNKFQNTKIVGYTSPSNMEFCQKAGVYDEVLSYDKMLPSSEKKYIMIDIAGRGDIYANNDKQAGVDIVKLLVVGNSSNTDDKKGTVATFSYYAIVKMICAMTGLPSFLHSWMHPTQEFFLIWEDVAAMKKLYGDEKFKKISKEKCLLFCQTAKEKWMSIREAKTEEEIEKAFTDILDGSVPPTETIVLDVESSVAHRKK